MYQLATLAPPPARRIQIAITNGSRFGNNALDVDWPRRCWKRPMGEPSARWPVKQVSDPRRRSDCESMEVWLRGRDYRYLAGATIRYHGRDGVPVRREVVTEISTSATEPFVYLQREVIAVSRPVF
jgi:hypothetical protein